MKHLLIMLSLFATFCYSQDEVYNRVGEITVHGYGNFTFINANFIGVIKAKGYDGWHRHWFDEVYSSDIHRYKAEVVLTFKGEPKSKDIIFCVETETPYGAAYDREPPLRVETDYQDGKLYLVYLYLPNEDQSIESAINTKLRIKLQSKDHYYMSSYGLGNKSNLIPLPDGDYEEEGNTPVEKAAAILTQAYEKEGNIIHAWSIIKNSPTFSIRDGKRIMHPPDGENPEFYDFYSNKLEPRLLKKAGENLIDRIRILAMSLSIGKEERRPEYESLLWQIDETYPDPDADISFPLLFKPQDKDSFIMLFANARLAFLRQAAIGYMDGDDLISETKVYKSQVIKMLDDPNKRVRTQAIRYLSFNVKDPDAPKPKFTWDGNVENEQEIIQYWKGKGG